MSAYDHIGEAGYLEVNDFIYSPSRLFFAVLETSGQFNIYAGDNPGDPAKVRVWSTNSTVRSGMQVMHLVLRKGPFAQSTKNLQIFMHDPNRGSSLEQLWASGGSGDLDSPMEAWLGDDGRLSLRQKQQGIWSEKWNNGFSDPLVEYSGVMEYDIKNGRHHPNGPPKAASQMTAFNETSAPQTPSLAIAYVLTTSKGWKTSTSIKVGSSFKASASIPFIGVGGELTTSLEVTQLFEWNEQKTTTETKTVNLPVNVPPGKAIQGQVIWKEEALTVPFTVRGTSTFRSGRTAPYIFKGEYDGIASWDVNVKYVEVVKGQENQAQAALDEMPGTPVP